MFHSIIVILGAVKLTDMVFSIVDAIERRPRLR